MGEWIETTPTQPKYYYWRGDYLGGVAPDELEEARDKLNGLIEERDTEVVEFHLRGSYGTTFRLTFRPEGSCLEWYGFGRKWTTFEPSDMDQDQWTWCVAEAYRAGQRSKRTS